MIDTRPTITFLDALADRLDRWAQESRTSGWSTHQVAANREAANDCRREAARLRAGPSAAENPAPRLTAEQLGAIVSRRFGKLHHKPCARPGVLTCALWECQAGDRCQFIKEAPSP